MKTQKLGEFIEKWHVKKDDWRGSKKLEVLGVSNVDGITATSHKKSKDLSKYLVIEPNCFAYNPYRINVGSIGLTPEKKYGLVSPAYTVFKVKDNILINPLGRFYYDISAGAAFGDVPYLLQYNPKANNTYYYTWRAFNNMLPFEFAFKDYLEIQLYHHFRGFLLNKVPLVRHLKWRSVLCAKAIAGTGSEDIDQVLRPISWDKPYVELGAGLENIFKIIRVDAVWRVNHNEQRFDQDFVERFAIYTSLQLQF